MRYLRSQSLRLTTTCRSSRASHVVLQAEGVKRAQAVMSSKDWASVENASHIYQRASCSTWQQSWQQSHRLKRNRPEHQGAETVGMMRTWNPMDCSGTGRRNLQNRTSQIRPPSVKLRLRILMSTPAQGLHY